MTTRSSAAPIAPSKPESWGLVIGPETRGESATERSPGYETRNCNCPFTDRNFQDDGKMKVLAARGSGAARTIISDMPATTPPAKHGQAWQALRRKAQR